MAVITLRQAASNGRPWIAHCALRSPSATEDPFRWPGWRPRRRLVRSGLTYRTTTPGNTGRFDDKLKHDYLEDITF